MSGWVTENGDDLQFAARISLQMRTRVRPAGGMAKSLSALLALALGSPLALALDLSRQVDFHIPAEPLSAALIEFSHETQIQVVVSGDIRGQMTRGVTGPHPIKDALRTLLGNSRLSFQVVGDTSIVISRTREGMPAGSAAVEDAGKVRSLGQRSTEALAKERMVGNHDTSSESPAQLQEVIVTATLRSENVQNVPAALTVLTGPQLNQLGAQNLYDVAALVPGLQLATIGPGFNVETLRGVSTGLFSTGATVATYFDEAPTTAVSLASTGDYTSPDPDLFDVQRIEVLKGPQGTLFGASAMGGVIRYIFNQPNLKRFEGRAELGFEGIPGHGTGNTSHLVLNLPLLKHTLAIRLEGFRLSSPGFIDNVYRNQRNVNISLSDGGRAEILWAPSRKFRARLSSYYQRMSAEAPSEEDVQPRTLKSTSGELKTAEKVPEPAYTKLFVNNLTVSYEFPWATLLSSTSLQQQSARLALDGTYVYGVLYGPLFGGNAGTHSNTVDTKKTTEEVRLTSVSGRAFDWIAGFYYTHEAADGLVSVDIYNATAGAVTLVYPGLVKGELTSLYKEIAEFGNVTYHFSPAFDVQAGMRYATVSQLYTQPFLLFGGAPLEPPFSGNATLHKSTYLAVARYHLNSANMLYMRVATGYRPGGPNLQIPSADAPRTYQSDSLINYELGIKGRLIGNSLHYAADVYRINWKNIQVQGADPASGYAYYTNGGRAHSQGLELSVAYRPVLSLRVGLSASFDQAKLDKSIAVPGATGKSGDSLPYAPETAFSGTLDYTHALTETATGFAGLTLTEVGSRRAYYAESTVGLAPLGVQFASTVGPLPSYTTLDLRAGISLQRVTLTFYAQNITDALGAVALNASQAGADFATNGISPAYLTVRQPRTFGLTAEYEFR